MTRLPKVPPLWFVYRLNQICNNGIPSSGRRTSASECTKQMKYEKILKYVEVCKTMQHSAGVWRKNTKLC